MSLMAAQHRTHTTPRDIEPQDWQRIQRLYAFCRARAIERIVGASQDQGRHRRALTTLETMYGKARQHNDIVASCAVSYFRAQAMKDAHHVDFLGEWISPDPR